MNYRIVSKSIIGNREEQQDALSVFKVGNLICAILCDGMGGYNYGSIASKSTVELFTDLIKRTNGEIPNIPDFLIKCIDALDENVCSIKDKNNEKAKAGTTVVICLIYGDKLYWLSVGDSRLYIFRDNEMVQATRDHNFRFTLEQMKMKKKITTVDYEAQKRKGEMLTSYIGMGGIDFFDICQLPFYIEAGDRFLLTSDGLYKTLAISEIQNTVLNCKDIKKSAIELVEKTENKHNQTQDNMSLIIIEATEDKK